MSAQSDFVAMATSDLLGKAPAPTIQAKKIEEQARRESPAMAGFVDMAVRDLGGTDGAVIEAAGKPQITAEQIKENADDLKNAFAKSVTEQAVSPANHEKAEEIITEFKKEAEAESQKLLETLLKGIR